MSNFDKLVEARIAKTGESWSTAARFVRAQSEGGPSASTPSSVILRRGASSSQPMTLDHLTLDEIDALRKSRGWRPRLAELQAKPLLSDDELAERAKLARFDEALEAELRRRNPGRFLGGLVPPSVEITWAPAEVRRPLQRDILARSKDDVVDAHYVYLRYDPEQGQSFDDAIEEARREARERSDLLEVGIRRTDRPGHPIVCVWKRRTVKEPWSFEWGNGAESARSAPPMLAAGDPTPSRGALSVSLGSAIFPGDSSGKSLRLKRREGDLLQDEQADSWSGTLTNWGRVGVLKSTKDAATFFIIEPADTPNEIVFDQFHVRGNFKIALTVSRTQDARGAWTTFRGE